MSQGEGVCRCGVKKGYQRDEDSIDELWVCANCGWPARMYLDKAYERATDADV